MTKRKTQTLTAPENQAVQQLLLALQAKDYKEARRAARAFLPAPPPLPRDPLKHRAQLTKRVREQLAAAERDGSHVAAMRLLRMLVDMETQDASSGARQGPMTPSEHIAQCQAWIEYTIQAVLGCPDILTDDRVQAAVDAARGGT